MSESLRRRRGDELDGNRDLREKGGRISEVFGERTMIEGEEALPYANPDPGKFFSFHCLVTAGSFLNRSKFD